MHQHLNISALNYVYLYHVLTLARFNYRQDQTSTTLHGTSSQKTSSQEYLLGNSNPSDRAISFL
jgi:hypothetical protein